MNLGKLASISHNIGFSICMPNLLFICVRTLAFLVYKSSHLFVCALLVSMCVQELYNCPKKVPWDRKIAEYIKVWCTEGLMTIRKQIIHKINNRFVPNYFIYLIVYIWVPQLKQEYTFPFATRQGNLLLIYSCHCQNRKSGPYKVKEPPFYSTFVRELCDDTLRTTLSLSRILINI